MNYRNLFVALALCTHCFSLHTQARPTNLQESKLSEFTRFVMGMKVGVETVLSLMGYYDNENGLTFNNDDEADLTFNNEAKKYATNIQVVGLGMGRTGTTSVALALEILGYTVIHDDEHVELSPLYEQLEEEDITWEEFHDIVGSLGYTATFKAGHKWSANHTEVKNILTVRDNSQDYVKSWLKAAVFIDYLEQRPYIWMRNVQDIYESMYEEYKEETTGGDVDNYLDPETLRTRYENYNEEVKRALPAEKLLVFNVKQGWEPLCAFLEKPVPEGIPFPHVHDRIKLGGEQFIIRSLTWTWPVFLLLPLLLPLTCHKMVCSK